VPCAALSSPGTLVCQGKKCGNAFHLVRRELLEHLLVAYSLAESSDNRRVGDSGDCTSYFCEARDKGPERLSGFLPHCMEVGLHAMLLVSTGEVRRERRTELFPGPDRSRSEVHEPSPGWSGQGYMKVARHDGVVAASCCDSGDVNLQELRRVSRTVILLRQVWAELGWPVHRAEMIC